MPRRAIAACGSFSCAASDKVKSIALLHGLTHNMVCGWRLMTA